MTLTVDSQLKPVEKTVFDWFVSRIREVQRIEFVNGIGYYLDGQLVAANANGRFFVKP